MTMDTPAVTDQNIISVLATSCSEEFIVVATPRKDYCLRREELNLTARDVWSLRRFTINSNFDAVILNSLSSCHHLQSLCVVRGHPLNSSSLFVCITLQSH